MELLALPSFDAPAPPPWEIEPNAFWTYGIPGYSYDADGGVFITASRNFIFGSWVTVAGWVRQQITNFENQVANASLWVRLDQVGSFHTSISLQAAQDPAGPYTQVAVLGSTLNLVLGEWTQLVVTDVVIPYENAWIRFYFAPPSGTATNYITIDLASLDGVEVPAEGDMAVMEEERVVRAMLATLQASLAGEITAINNERNDGLTLSAPTHWYCWERETASPDVVECEVYVPSPGVTFPLIKRDQSTWIQGARTRMNSIVPLIVAINVANRSMLKPSQLWTLSTRAKAAILRTIRNNPNLGQVDKVVAWPQNSRTMVRKTSGEGAESVQRCEVLFQVTQEESPSGEASVGGGVPPACILET